MGSEKPFRVTNWMLVKVGFMALVAFLVALFHYWRGRRSGEAKTGYRRDIERIDEAEKGSDTGFLRDDIIKRSKK